LGEFDNAVFRPKRFFRKQQQETEAVGDYREQGILVLGFGMPISPRGVEEEDKWAGLKWTSFKRGWKKAGST